MIYLFLCIISSTIILLLFKYLDNKGIDSFQTIVVNYLVAVILGLVVFGRTMRDVSEVQQTGLPFAFLVGVLFIVVFFLIARSTRYAGVAATSVATKMNQTMEEVIDGMLDSFLSQRALTEGMSTLHQFSAESNALNQVDNITHRMNSEILKSQKATSLSAGVGGKIYVPLAIYSFRISF